ncbi:MAG: DUF58 domain-containing protein [Deltaproteobacteria bacterium]|nr:MAG: DUF58 domain-containing protein [Deltaproteobacteria bacterium]
MRAYPDPPSQAGKAPSLRKRARRDPSLQPLVRRKRRLRITRMGGGFILLSLAVGFAAMNTGMNLLFLMLGMMLSMISASGFLSMISLSRVRLSRQAPRKVQAGEPFPVRVELANQKRFFPSYSLRIMEAASKPGKMEGPRTWAYCLKLPPRHQVTLFYEQRMERRGVHPLPPVTLQTTFPFGFFHKSRFFPMKTEVLAYPPLGEVTQAVLERLDRSVSEQGGSRNALSEENFFGIREYRPGDNPRWIHWKSTARLHREMVKEFEREEREKVMLYLHAVVSSSEAPAGSVALERAISLTATLACHFQEAGHPVGLATFTPEPILLPPATTQEHLEEILTTLALLEAAEGGELSSFLEEGNMEGTPIVIAPVEIPPPLPGAEVLVPTEAVFQSSLGGGVG